MIVEPRSAKQTDSNAGSASALGGDSSTFMKLLMTQLQAQDPMSPMDTNTFVSQLVQFNTLDQITQIRELIQSAAGLGDA